MIYYCGIDIPKHRHELSVLDEADEAVLNMHITNSQKGLEKLLGVAPVKWVQQGVDFKLIL